MTRNFFITFVGAVALSGILGRVTSPKLPVAKVRFRLIDHSCVAVKQNATLGALASKVRGPLGVTYASCRNI
jgi:hypothetical protein